MSDIPDQPPKKRPAHRPVGPNGPRVRLWPNGTHVDPRTAAIITEWRARWNVPLGRIIDCLVDYATAENSAFKLSVLHQYSRMPAPYGAKKVEENACAEQAEQQTRPHLTDGISAATITDSQSPSA